MPEGFAELEDKTSKEWRLFCEMRFPELPFDCGRMADAGVVDVDEWRDWSELETTPDQRRIERYIARFSLRGKRVLHVGVGNSDLAKRFHRKLGVVVGTTVVHAEMEKGTALGLANYRVVMHNKYLESERPTGTYHFIVDNNPTTFCCCLRHFRVMMEWYANSLEPDGQIVTDRVGLGWTTELEPDNSRWKFTFEDLQAVASFSNLLANRVDENTYVLSRGQPEMPAPSSRISDFVERLERAVQRRARFVLEKLRMSIWN